VAAAAGDHDALNRSFANQARLTLASVDPMLKLKESFLAVGVHVVRDGRTAKRDGFFEHFLDRGVKQNQFLASKRGGSAPGTDAAPKQRFIRINIAYAAQQFLVQ